MIKVYVVGGSDYYASPIKGAVLTDNIKKAQIVLFTGGEDVTPSIYNEKDCGISFTNFNRDVREKTIFSHMTALYFHNLTEIFPSSFEITVDKNSSKMNIDDLFKKKKAFCS